MAKKSRSEIIEGDGDTPRLGRPRKQPLAVGGNVSDATIREYIDRVRDKMLAAERDKEIARQSTKAVRDTLKAAARVGVDPDAIRWYIGAARLEATHLERMIAWQSRMARLMELPIGTQLGWNLLTGETVAEAAPEAPAVARRRQRRNGEADPRASYVLGYNIAKAGESRRKLAGLTGKARIEGLKGYEAGLAENAASSPPPPE